MIEIGNARGLIFDCDGTLIDSMPLHMKAWEHAFFSIGEVYNHTYLDSKKGMKESDIIELYNKDFSRTIDPHQTVQIKHNYFKAHLELLKPIQPVVDIVLKYYGVKNMGVVSGSTREIVHQELEVIGIKDKFDYILTADDPFKPKPAPDKFFEAARRMNLSPEDCLVFEDGDLGILAAQKAGMRTIDVRKID